MQINKITRIGLEGYSVVSNSLSNDPNVSLKTKGLYYIIMTLPDWWDFTIAGIVKIVPEGKYVISKCIRELIALGYAKRERVREGGRNVGYNYTFYAEPDVYKQEEPKSNFQTSENSPQYITNKDNILKIDTMEAKAQIDLWFDEDEVNYIPEPLGPIQPKMFKEKTKKPQQVESIPRTAHIALYGVCYLADTEQKALALDSTQRGRVASALGRLREAGADLDRIRDFEDWWRDDWRSKAKGTGAYQTPRPDQVVEHWFVAMENTKPKAPEREELNGVHQISSEELAQTMQRIAQMRREGQ